MEEKTVLMQHSASDRQGSQQSQIPDGYIVVARKLRAQGVRCIPESEIGLSVLHCSMAHFCNPRYNAQSLLGSHSSSVEPTQPMSVICLNTEESANSNQIQDDSGSVVPVPSISRKRAHENLSGDEDHISKRPAIHTNSEDLFGSENSNNNIIPKSLNSISVSLKKSISPNGASSAVKEQVPLPYPGQSLDMFTSSGERNRSSNVPNPSETRPSCEDMFGSARSRQHSGKQTNNNDEFAFLSNKKSNKTQRIASNEGDEFSFTSNKRSNKVQDRLVDEDDEFSFTSNKMSNKRIRQSNSDIFASTAGSSTKNDNNIAGPSKIRKTEEESVFRKRNQSPPNNNLFAFPGENKIKRKRHCEGLMDSGETSNEVKIALLSKSEAVLVPNDLQSEKKPKEIEKPPEEKNLITYSKFIPIPEGKKEEVEDEEIDELAKELHNATIIVFKPLVVARPRPADMSTDITGKNFKKFQKVVGINKRMVPHIIGGSDLVPNGECVPLNDLLPPSPPHQNHMPDDEWAFQKNKKRGKHSGIF